LVNLAAALHGDRTMPDYDTSEMDETNHPIPQPPLGDATVRLDVDEETYERLHAAFCQLLEHGYDAPFDEFVHNNCRTDYVVTVDGSDTPELDDVRRSGRREPRRLNAETVLAGRDVEYDLTLSRQAGIDLFENER
jgi:hypothetical protein